ncbi:response regulator transcription factor [Blastococcus brunescens]|uniref:LuxR C-terminal-related transcriptional regulator n=1 Tax=Blastococcus brunescens TaxID=1564165 RepID=A0ABZ1AZG4_9ACTN|nr:LuxR C-terminal-related transcriptional regulator [Blastococcus sp. BMG 8361]WRL63960.1 LuxR C-terminal-related transcriptional regulator [Blastococcus sp. BMG 8361]
MAALSDREREVLQLLGSGGSNAELATRLFVSEATVKTYVSRLLTKLDLGPRPGGDPRPRGRPAGRLTPAGRAPVQTVASAERRERISSTTLVASTQIRRSRKPPNPPMATSHVSSWLSKTPPRPSTSTTALAPER